MNNKIEFFPFLIKKYLYIYIFLFYKIITLIKASEDSKNIIVIPFKSYYPKINSEETKQTNTFNSWFKQKLYLEMENSSGQKASMILTLDQIEAHSKEDIALLASDEIYIKQYTQNINDICSFDYEKSPNFKCQTPYNVFILGRDKCCIIEEKFIFYTDDKLSEKKIYPLKFIHSTNKTNICLFGSLQRYLNAVDKSRSFIDQLKVLSNAKNFTWTLKYTSYDSGLFIFGDIIDNEKLIFDKKNKVKNIEQNYESIYALNLFTGRIFWKFNIDKLFIGDKVLGENENIEIETDIPFILVKKEYLSNIKEQIFNEYFENKICNKILAEYKFSGISCNKKAFYEKTNNLKNFPSLIFQIRQHNLNITFTSNELFRLEGDDLFFLIAHQSYKDDHFTVGSIFLRKYTTIFDVESKQIKIFKNVNDEKTNIGYILKIILIVFLFIILSGLIFGFIGLNYGKKIYQARKLKANELDDNYDYTQYSGKNDINFDKKNSLYYPNDEHNKNKNKNVNNISLEMTKS